MCYNLQIVERSKSRQVVDFAARSRAAQGCTVHAPSVDKGGRGVHTAFHTEIKMLTALFHSHR